MKKIILLFILALVGCKESTPKCDNQEVKDLVVQIVTKNYFGGILPFKFFDTNVNNIRVVDYNKSIDVYTCKASFSGKFGAEDIRSKPELWQEASKELIYTVQLNSEKQIYVEVKW